MPYLIDGNNLIFALRKVGLEVGRGGLCAILREFQHASRDRVTVVFDGVAATPTLDEQFEGGRIETRYSGTQEADDIICELATQSPDLKHCTDPLVQTALERGGLDNITVILVRAGPPSARNRPS